MEYFEVLIIPAIDCGPPPGSRPTAMAIGIYCRVSSESQTPTTLLAQYAACQAAARRFMRGMAEDADPRERRLP